MSDADNLFSKAYELSVVDEKHREAIELCRQAIEIDPNNYQVRVFLGILLADVGTEEEKREGRQEFVEAIVRASSVSVICDSGYEESAIHHLGIWEWTNMRYDSAGLFFLADFLTCKSNQSYKYLLEILKESHDSLTDDMKLLLSRISGQGLS